MDEALGPVGRTYVRPLRLEQTSARTKRSDEFFPAHCFALPRLRSARRGTRTPARWLRVRFQPSLAKTLSCRFAGPQAALFACSAPPHPTAWTR